MLGNYPTETGYIQFLVNQLTGLNVSYQLTNDVTIVVMSLIVTVSLSLNSIDFVRWYKRRKITGKGIEPQRTTENTESPDN